MNKLLAAIVPAVLLAGCAGTPPAGVSHQSYSQVTSTGSHLAGASTGALSTTDTSHMTNNNATASVPGGK